DRDRIGELEALNVRLVDLVERRVALGIIGAMIHQPVLRLAVGVDEAIGRDVSRHRRRDSQQCRARDQIGRMGTHSFLLFVGWALRPLEHAACVQFAARRDGHAVTPFPVATALAKSRQAPRRVTSAASGDSATLDHGLYIPRLYQWNESQLSAFSVPS